MLIETEINGDRYILDCDPFERAIDILRGLGLTSVKEGCGEGECGACTIHLDSKSVNSCLLPAIHMKNGSIRTLEGMKEETAYLSEEFAQASAIQCGFCTPGFIMRGHSYISSGGGGEREEIRRALDGNICRCTGYAKIVDALQSAIATLDIEKDSPKTAQEHGTDEREKKVSIKTERKLPHYLEAKDIREAVEHLENNPDYEIMCGSTDIMISIKSGKSARGYIDIGGIDSLKEISVHDEMISIGSAVTIAELTENEAISRYLPILRETASTFASSQIRNLATIGGNIMHGSPVGDMQAPLVALGAEAVVRSIDTIEKVAVEKLFHGYKESEYADTIVTSFEIPIRKHRWYYRKVGGRKRLNISKLSLSIVSFADGDFGVSGASLNPYPKRFTTLENLLKRGERDRDRIMEAIEVDISPRGSFRSTVEYRKSVLLNMVMEAIERFDSDG